MKALLAFLLFAATAGAQISPWLARVKAQNSDLFAFEGATGRVWSYRMTIVETEHRLVTGARYKVWAFGGTVPAPTLVVREGDTMRIRVTNETSAEHTIHSHGLFVPQRMDGVPHLHGARDSHAQHTRQTSMPKAIAPGESFTYEYIARPSGTHWYHCHVNTNEHLNRGMAGVLIVLPREPDPAVDVEDVLLLQEWNSKYAQGGQPGHPRETHEADVFTINGLSFPDTKRIAAEIGQTCRLRVVNAGMQFHSIHLHGHSFLVTHKDGAPLAEPPEMDTVAVGPGERVDLVLVANNPGEWPLHCHDSSHQTNGGLYPGGMMTHLLIGAEPSPQSDGPVAGPALAEVRKRWRRSAQIRLSGSP
jgi:FtsP/CotA-like multicopper oxidase with cupredoxin domain